MRSVFIACVLSTTALLAACSEKFLFKPNEAETRFEAAESHFSIVSIQSWEEVASALKPNFSLTKLQGDGEGSALKAVLPTTSLFEERVLDFFGAAVQATINKQGTGTQSSSQGTTNAAAEAKVDLTNLATVKDAAKGFPIKPANEGEQKLSQDPILRYKLAAALIQEVSQLNSLIEKAAIGSEYEPYLVRLQLGSMPYVRHQPYDIYVTMSFFNAIHKDQRRDDVRRAKLRQPVVVPLVVTDNIEAGVASRSARVVRQLALALNFLSKGASGSLALQSFNDRFAAVLGTEQNSLFTIGRITDNTIRIRMGAPFNPTSEYAMVPRTHSISVLLMVHKNQMKYGSEQKWKLHPEINVATSTELRHVHKGRRPLKSINSFDDFDQELEAFRKNSLGASKSELTKVLWNDGLVPAVLTNNAIEYERILRKSKFGWAKTAANPKSPNYQGLWQEITQMMSKSKYHNVNFEIPKPPEPDISNSSLIKLDRKQNASVCGHIWDKIGEVAKGDLHEIETIHYAPKMALLQDIGDGKAKLSIGNVYGFQADRVRASLVVLTDKGFRHELAPLATEIGMTAAGAADSLAMSFQSPKNLGIGNFQPRGSYALISYEPAPWRSRQPAQRYILCAVQYVTSKAPKPTSPTQIPIASSTLLDDNASSAEVRFSNVTGLVSDRLTAVLQVPHGNGVRPWHATNAEYKLNNKTLIITFPSLSKHGFDTTKLAAEQLKIDLLMAPSPEAQAAGEKGKSYQLHPIYYVVKK